MGEEPNTGAGWNMGDKLVLICLAIWALLFGILHVTNISIVWADPVMGFAALILGIVCLIRALR